MILLKVAYRYGGISFDQSKSVLVQCGQNVSSETLSLNECVITSYLSFYTRSTNLTCSKSHSYEIKLYMYEVLNITHMQPFLLNGQQLECWG